jgi:phage baseplate assembly protein W
MLVVVAIPPGGPFIEFVRIDIVASDNGLSPIITGPFEIVYTTDGTVPRVDINGLPLDTAKKRRSPVLRFPIDKPTTLKFFARTTDGVTTTTVTSVFFDIQEVTAKNEIHTAQPGIRNYTLTVLNGDIQKDSGGLYSIVAGVDKTKQDIREVILVENIAPKAPIGNRTLPNFGSSLNRLLGAALPPSYTRGEIQTTVFEALTFLQQLQREENVPADEQIRRILSISVQPLDPTSFRYSFTVEMVSGVRVTDSGILGG